MLGSSAASLLLYVLALAVCLVADPAAFTDPASPALWALVLLLMVGVIVGNLRAIALVTLVTLLVPAEGRDRANGQVGTVNGVSFLVTSVISGVLVGLSGMFVFMALLDAYGRSRSCRCRCRCGGCCSGC
jgi:DHA3 family multidrug efflux protein-like MFS transporter